jgi:Rps23 Pro-64 3,4-dihydroxylase Tpa1-like proline 4-hydroxylase
LVSNSCSEESNEESDIVLVVFTGIKTWDKNSYGELVVYDMNDDEIFKSIHPKNGRIVLISCGYSYVIRPPSMDCKERLHTLTIRVTASTSGASAPSKKIGGNKVRQDSSQQPQAIQERQHEAIRALVHTVNESNLDIVHYVTRQFYTTKGHPIIVFDDVIPKNILDVFADTMLNGTYTDNPPDPYSTDNVPWILAFEVEPIVESPLWNYIQPIARLASKKDGFYPYDISCNTIRSHDLTKIHTDCSNDQEEYTLLIYLNRNWTNNDLGETVFFNYDIENDKEMVFAIKPKYGRVAIFHGTIPHSARPPSPLFHGRFGWRFI